MFCAEQNEAIVWMQKLQKQSSNEGIYVKTINLVCAASKSLHELYSESNCKIRDVFIRDV
jgi:hypothetical protein